LTFGRAMSHLTSKGLLRRGKVCISRHQTVLTIGFGNLPMVTKQASFSNAASPVSRRK
jgi:hypothetical protein